MKNIFLAFLCLFSGLLKSQQMYFDFEWESKVGIVNKKGKEIVSPIYSWKNYVIPNSSSSIVLMNNPNGKYLIINKNTGKREKIDLIQSSMVINIENAKYLLINKGNKAFLMNTSQTDKRLVLPKKYEDVWQLNDYLIAFEKSTKYGEQNTAEILLKDSFKSFVKTLPIKFINDFKTAEGKDIYVVIQNETTLFFDTAFKPIDRIEKELSVKEIPTAFKELTGIKLIEPKQEILVGAEGIRKYPSITSEVDLKNDYITYSIKTSKDTKEPFFRIKINNRRFYDNFSNNHVEIEDIKTSKWVTFYLNLEDKTILLPKKYQKAIGIELLK